MNKHIYYLIYPLVPRNNWIFLILAFQWRTHESYWSQLLDKFEYNSTLMQLSSRQYHALPTHCHPCSVSQCHWAGKRKFGELSPIGDTDAPIEFSHQFRQNRQNSTRQNPTLGWKITTRPEWVGNFLHARGFECGTRALHYYHWNSSEMLTT